MHWFWRAAIAVVVGIIFNVILAMCFSIEARYTLWWNTLLGSIEGVIPRGYLYQPIYLFLSRSFLHLPIVFVTFAAYGILTRYFSSESDEKAPRCLNCGYNLTGNVNGVCPECGEKIEGRMLPPPLRD